MEMIGKRIIYKIAGD